MKQENGMKENRGLYHVVINRFSKILGGYSISKVTALVFAIYCFIGWPVEPPKDLKPSDMYEVIGKPTFRDSITSRMSDTYFFVGDLRLNCSLGLLDGLNGCVYFRSAITEKSLVKATYYLMSTRVGTRYPVLYSLEQDGKTVASPQITQVHVERSYNSKWLSFFLLICLLAIVMAAAIFIDRANTVKSKISKEQ